MKEYLWQNGFFCGPAALQESYRIVKVSRTIYIIRWQYQCKTFTDLKFVSVEKCWNFILFFFPSFQNCFFYSDCLRTLFCDYFFFSRRYYCVTSCGLVSFVIYSNAMQRCCGHFANTFAKKTWLELGKCCIFTRLCETLLACYIP